jgi:hypothetical protein
LVVTKRVLLDASPLVALFSERDQYHTICVEQLRALQGPLITCWPVLTEAAYMLRQRVDSLRALIGGFSAGLFSLAELDDSDLPSISAILERYHKLAPQLADATLLHLAERDGIDTVFTLDRRDFTVFRRHGKSPLRLLP